METHDDREIYGVGVEESVDNLLEFGKRVKYQRERMGMSQQELAQLLGYKSRSSINKIELGKNDVAQSTIQKLADALDTTPAYLMGWAIDAEHLVDDIQSGRTTAVEDMFRTYGIKHNIRSVRQIEDKVALLYYNTVDQHSTINILDIIETVVNLDRNDIAKIRQVIHAYLHADPPIKEIVDTALKPYKPEDFSDIV